MQLSVSDACVYFYPRSPCGERPVLWRLTMILGKFLSTLSLRRATGRVETAITSIGFLSTLSLRRATERGEDANNSSDNFYPRSPCGERHRTVNIQRPTTKFLSTLSLRRATVKLFRQNYECFISIHALLAESDKIPPHCFLTTKTFLSTLSLRRAT